MNGKRFDFMFILYKKRILNKKYKKIILLQSHMVVLLLNPVLKK